MTTANVVVLDGEIYIASRLGCYIPTSHGIADVDTIRAAMDLVRQNHGPHKSNGYTSSPDFGGHTAETVFALFGVSPQGETK